MKRTFIVTIETSGKEDGRTMHAAEEDFLLNCSSMTTNINYPHCDVHVDICVVALAQALIDDLCNPKAMDTYLCSYFLPGDQAMLYFKCEATDDEHAREQLLDAEPNATDPYVEIIYARKP